MNKTILSEFLEWLDKTNFEFNKFNLLTNKLEYYLLEHILNVKRFIKKVATKFFDALNKCYTINYQDNANIIDYIILHFLNRYRRFHI